VAAIDEVIRQLPVEEPKHKGLQKVGLLESALHMQIQLK
jgi:hypothetical protein